MSRQPVDERARARPENGGQPPYLYPDYVATRLRAPKKPLVILPRTLSDTTGPAYGRDPIGKLDNDLTRGHEGEPLGERIIVTGRVLDGDGRPVRSNLVEIWQANAAGRYTHRLDRHPAPLDPNFSGAGRCLTDDEGRYRFVTIKPGAYPWKNHDNAWRPVAELDYVTSSRAASTALAENHVGLPMDPTPGVPATEWGEATPASS